MSSDDEHPPKQLLHPISSFLPTTSTLAPTSMASQESSLSKTPYRITFPTREAEILYTQKLLASCGTYDGTPERLASWLKDTSAVLSHQEYPETDHPFIIRHLLIDDALDFYLAHEDLIFNFYDLRKLFLQKQNALAPLRTVSSLDSVGNLTFTSAPPILTSTQLPPTAASTTANTSAIPSFIFAQSLEDLTQNDIRKTIIEDLQRNTTKFTGDNRQDILKWLKDLESKFETAGIPDVKKFDLISQLLDKGALDWFRDHKTSFDHSWSSFVTAFKLTFDSPNRARIAMQKLHSYHQSLEQDVRSFCREMRKLFLEADPQMSSTMKLELLLAKVHPSYRLDLLKQKPPNPDAFETMAKDLENTYLVYDAIEQNLQSSVPFSSGDASLAFTTPYSTSSRPSFFLQRASNTHTSPSSTSSRPSPRSSSRYASLPSTHPRVPPPFRPSVPNHGPSPYYPPRASHQPSLSAYRSSPTSLPPQPPSGSSLGIPPLMSASTSARPTDRSSPPSSLFCHSCSMTGHSASHCPF